MKLAHFYQLSTLVELCGARMLATLDLDSYVQTVNCFDKYRLTKGYQIFSVFGGQHLSELKLRSDYNSLPHSFIRMLECTDPKK
jgi:hypothetical protein